LASESKVSFGAGLAQTREGGAGRSELAKAMACDGDLERRGGAGRGGEERVVSGNLWNGVKRKRRDRERAVETTGTGEGTGGGGGGIPGEGGGWINFPSFFSPPPHPRSFSWIFLCGRYLNCSESAHANNIFYLLDDPFFVYVSVFFHR
jgi:hypothetical protein